MNAKVEEALRTVAKAAQAYVNWIDGANEKALRDALDALDGLDVEATPDYGGRTERENEAFRKGWDDAIDNVYRVLGERFARRPVTEDEGPRPFLGEELPAARRR